MGTRGTGLRQLPDGCTGTEAISAMAQEAKRRNTSYGLLIASTTEWERDEIIRAYCAGKRKKSKKS